MNRNLFYILGVAFVLTLICIGLMSAPASAYPRVPQGGIVYWNETYDISGVAAGYKYLVYTNPLTTAFAADNESITYMIELPQQKEPYYNFTITSDPFESRTGYWFRYNGDWDSHVNNRAFRVVLERPPANYTPNATERQELALPPAPPIVPERHISDYLVVRGDPFVVDYNWSEASIWLFGRVTGIYDRRVVNGTATFNASEIDDLEPGSYTLVYYSPGANQRFELRIIDGTLEYFDSDAFRVRSLDVSYLSPMVLLDRLRWLSNMNDDNFTEYKLEVQNPMIDIVSIDTIIVDAYNQTGVIQVRGHTNLANESVISFVLDEDKTPERTFDQSRMQNRWNTTTLSLDSPGSMRYFDYGIPVFLGQMPPGPHTITAYGSHNTRMNVDFWIYDVPEGSRPRNQTIRYVGGYEFVPTPTPEIVIKKEIVKEIVTQIVQVPVTPSNEQVHSEQMKVQWEFWTTVAMWLFAAIVIIAFAGYAFLVWRRL